MTTGESLALRLDPNDNVAIARGSVLSESAGVVVGADIPAAHKVAIADIGQSDPVRRYGQIIGFATHLNRERAVRVERTISPKELVH